MYMSEEFCYVYFGIFKKIWNFLNEALLAKGLPKTRYKTTCEKSVEKKHFTLFLSKGFFSGSIILIVLILPIGVQASLLQIWEQALALFSSHLNYLKYISGRQFRQGPTVNWKHNKSVQGYFYLHSYNKNVSLKMKRFLKVKTFNLI